MSDSEPRSDEPADAADTAADKGDAQVEAEDRVPGALPVDGEEPDDERSPGQAYPGADGTAGQQPTS